MDSAIRFFLCMLFGCLLFRVKFLSAQSDLPIETDKNIISDVFDWIKFKNPFDDFMKFVKPIEDDSIRAKSLLPKDSDSWFVKSVRTAIQTTSKYCKSKKPLTFFTALDETCLVNRTGKSLQVTILNPITVATMTGGILGDDLFELHDCSFAWREDSCNATHNLEVRVLYRNLKYGSFEQGMDSPDGIVIVIFPIATNGDFPNPKFNQFSHFLQTKIKAPGDHATIHSAFTYTWFVNFPFGSVYHTYTMSYFDENTGKTTNAIVIELPLDQRVNFISNEQFQETLGRMTDIRGQKFQENVNLSPVERQKGIVVLNLPA